VIRQSGIEGSYRYLLEISEEITWVLGAGHAAQGRSEVAIEEANHIEQRVTEQSGNKWEKELEDHMRHNERLEHPKSILTTASLSTSFRVTLADT
jgi:hypothetical protein